MPPGRGWWRASDSSPVQWLTPAGSLTPTPLAIDRHFTADLDAVSPAGGVGYGPAPGAAWPGWLSLDPLSGVVAGLTVSDPALAPVWTHPGGALAPLGIGEAVALSLSATAAGGGPLSYGLIAGGLPWGLTLNGASGLLSGAPGRYLPGPVEPRALSWLAPAPGSLGTVEEGAAFLAACAVGGASAYHIVAGALPWGLVLEAGSGVISGTAAAIGGGGIDLPPLVWDQPPAGSLGQLGEGDLFSLALLCPGAGAYGVVAGALPWGLVLDPLSGAISGTVADLGGALDPPAAPAITLPALDPLAVGVPVDLTPGATSANGAITGWWLAEGALPWGLVLDSTDGRLHGTPGPRPGAYAATLAVRDSRGASAYRSLTLTVI